MNHIGRILATCSVWLSIACTLMTMSGCGPLVTLNASRAKYDQNNDITPPSPAQDTFLVETAHRFGLMALFAEAVYRRDLKEESRDGSGCRYLKNKHESDIELRYGMPRSEGGQWKRWIPASPLNGASPCFDEFGLYYETYIYEDVTGKITEAVIAFRGTENRRGQYLHDWGSNIAAALGFEPKQYELVSTYVPLIVEGLRERFKVDGTEVKIYATGHSLGGGLAQQAGYLSKDIKEVFTFNTSPVTNWSFLRLRGAVRNGYPIFHRIYHGGEFLEKIRFFSSSFTEARYGRHDIGLQFEERSDFSGHSMKIIACNFAKIIDLRKPAIDAEHQYPVQYIRRYILSKDSSEPPDAQICSEAA